MAKSDNRYFLARMEFWPIPNNLGYYNLRPYMEILGNTADPADPSEFPNHGTINVKDAVRRKSGYVQDAHYYVFRITNAELMSLEKNSNGLCIEYDDYMRKVQTVDNYGISEIISVSPYSAPNIMEFASWGDQAQDWGFVPFTRLIYLSDRNHVVGPFTWSETEGRCLLQPAGSGSDAFLVDCYLDEDLETYSFSEKSPERRERRFIILEALPERSRQKIDCISDAKLKEIIGSFIAECRGAQSRQERREIIEAVGALPSEALSGTRRERVLRMAQQGNIASEIVAQIAQNIFSSPEGQKQVLDIVLRNDDYLRSLHTLAKEDMGYSRVVDQINAEKQMVIKPIAYSAVAICFLSVA